MKWNFECKSQWRDYLHNHLIARCNDFASPAKLYRSGPRRPARLAGIFSAGRATFFGECDIETIVARQFEYSVSDFIDCLTASLNIICAHRKIERDGSHE
jgi:hypothetical protein